MVIEWAVGKNSYNGPIFYLHSRYSTLRSTGQARLNNSTWSGNDQNCYRPPRPAYLQSHNAVCRKYRI